MNREVKLTYLIVTISMTGGYVKWLFIVYAKQKQLETVKGHYNFLINKETLIFITITRNIISRSYSLEY